MDGVIAGVGAAVTRDQLPHEARVVDCKGDVVAPELIDMRAFVGEPGAEHRETIASASAAAAAGGVTSLVMRPDTNPPVDDPAVVDFILRRARDDAKVRIFPSAALTKGLMGREIAEIGREANPQEAHRRLHRSRDEDVPPTKTAGREDDRKARGFPNQGRPERDRPRKPQGRRRAAGAQLKCRADGVCS